VYLKRMELFGFKSFAEKSELSLGPGIAAVIGPNGCGKSNIVDAVRWALGEQSVKSLRGTKMEEVIFSGSESRKALNFAEVSLTFEGASEFLNLDYNEITITRRLFRNGDSEYYINKSPCRLKDITELFLDTGLGKDIYSIIGQGRVDEIINSRPEERREIFEEAAGIFKYKLRKREARRRLDETRENLVRVQDLIYELETQIEPLQNQAEITRRYRALKERIEEEEKKLLSFQLQLSREQLAKTNKQLQAVNDALLASAARVGLHESEIQELKGSFQEHLKGKQEEEQKLNQVSRSLEHEENDLKIILERESRFKDQLDKNRQKVEELDLLMQEYADQKVKAEHDLKTKSAELAELENELAVLRQEMAGHQASALASEVDKSQQEIYKAGNRKEAAASTIEELNRRLERLQIQKNNYREENLSLQDKLKRLHDEAELLETKGLQQHDNVLLPAVSALEKEIANEAAIKEKVELLSKQVQKKRETLHGVKSRLQLLEEQDSALSGYYRGVKEIMQARSSLPGIIGPVADLISVDGEYIQAIESALGSALQYLVADTEKAVQGAIGYLKSGSRGWATFLPLDILHKAADPLERYPGWRDQPGVIGKASELVRADTANRKAVDYLMSSILVCRTLEDASKAARFVKHSCRVVTLDGEMINPGGIIRGGSLPKRNAGMPLGRRKEIEALQEQHATLLKDLRKSEEDIAAAEQSLQASAKTVTALSIKKQEALEQLAEMQKETEMLLREQSVISDRIKVGTDSVVELEAEGSELNQRLQAAKAEIESCIITIENHEKELAVMKEDYRHFLEAKNALDQNITGVLVKISSFREQREALIGRIAEIDANSKRPAAETEQKESESATYRDELVANKTLQEQIAARVKDYNSEKAALIIALEGKVQLINNIEAQLIELEEEGRRSQGQVARQEKRERQLSMEQTRLQTEVSFQEMRFKELFKTLELVVLDEDYEPEESRMQIEYLKEDLEALGEVNLGAIEELTRLEDRIKFLTEQKDDLQEGEASLQKVLAEIDQRMEFYFKKAFETINENFTQTFRELFEGGQVLLKLTDTDNILESGIEIVAQPPGKKLQNITLMSGGEKVLTAIALVFAILRFKPAPFYLLDEIESMLDDANLSRFTNFLKQTATQAQFILITHRKRTMEEAAVLYGVTMPEPGVSRLVSLKMENNVISRES
jgi:chromosome segregation protein